MKTSLIDFFFSMFCGVALHQTSSFTKKIDSGWQELTGTTIGVIGTLPLFSLWMRRLEGVQNPYTRATCAYLLAFLGVGSGVALGWLIDTIFKINRE